MDSDLRLLTAGRLHDNVQIWSKQAGDVVIVAVSRALKAPHQVGGGPPSFERGIPCDQQGVFQNLIPDPMNRI